MMRRCLVACSLFISTLVLGQKKDYLSVSFISAFPTGDFSKTEVNYVSSILGYAKSGFGGDVTYVHRNNSNNFGFAASLRIRQNSIDTGSIMSEKKAINPWNPNTPFAWTKKEVKWLLKSIMVGGYYGKSLSKRIILNGKIFTGIAKATLPEINWTAIAKSPYAGKAEFQRDRSTSICLSSCITTGFEYNLTKKISFLVNGEYWYAKPTFKDVNQSYLERYGNSSSGGSGKVIYAVDMSTINVTLGVALSL